LESQSFSKYEKKLGYMVISNKRNLKQQNIVMFDEDNSSKAAHSTKTRDII